MSHLDTASEIVQKHGRYNAETPLTDYRYYVRVSGHCVFAKDTWTLVEKVAAHLEAEEKGDDRPA